MKNTVYFYGFILSLSLLCSCGKSDLAFVNQVLTIEPKWMDLTDKVSYIDRNLQVTDLRYDKDYMELGKLSTSAPKDSTGKVISSSFGDGYKKMQNQKNEIKKEFKTTQERFVKTRYAFEEWKNKVTQNKIDGKSGKGEYEKYNKEYAELNKKMEDLKVRLVHNIEDHNRLTRAVALSANNYTNYNIDPH